MVYDAFHVSGFGHAHIRRSADINEGRRSADILENGQGHLSVEAAANLFETVESRDIRDGQLPQQPVHGRPSLAANRCEAVHRDVESMIDEAPERQDGRARAAPRHRVSIEIGAIGEVDRHEFVANPGVKTCPWERLGEPAEELPAGPWVLHRKGFKMSNQPTRLDKQDARQGRSGVGVRNVLIGGLVLVIVVFIILYFVLRAMPVHN